MHKSFVLLTGAAILYLSSCKKDKEQLQASQNYLPLKPGNYWIYEQNRVDGDGDAHFQSLDSIYVTADTVLGNDTFHVMMLRSGSQPPVLYRMVKDSLHYLVDYYQGIIFSSLDFNTIFHTAYFTSFGDTVAILTTQMVDKYGTYSVPAGTFTTATFRKTFSMQPGWQQGGTIRHEDKRYAAGTGMVQEVMHFYSFAPDIWERKLLRYHVD